MKTSTIASLLFGTLAIAAPLEKRRYVTKTSVVVQTEVVYVTVYEGQAPVAAPTTTSTPGLFYEHPPKSSSSSAAVPTSTSTSKKEEPAYTPPPAPKPSSSSSTSTPPPAPTSVYTPPPPPPAPTTSEYVAPPAPSSSAPASPSPSPSPPPTSGGTEYHGEMTVYDTYGGNGACGTVLSDDEFTAAISKDSWGADIWGSADNLNGNPWCGKTATVTYGGQTVTVKIMDKCQGCKPGDIDLTRAAWNKLTNNAYGSRVQASWVS